MSFTAFVVDMIYFRKQLLRPIAEICVQREVPYLKIAYMFVDSKKDFWKIVVLFSRAKKRLPPGKSAVSAPFCRQKRVSEKIVSVWR